MTNIATLPAIAIRRTHNPTNRLFTSGGEISACLVPNLTGVNNMVLSWFTFLFSTPDLANIIAILVPLTATVSCIIFIESLLF